MRNYDIKHTEIKLHNILFTVTGGLGYEMERLLILEDMPGTEYDEFVLVEGYHCSCYDFDDCSWEATVFNEEELIKILEKNDCDDLRKKAVAFMKEYLGR